MKIIILTLLSSLVTPTLLIASGTLHPKVTNISINGVWEAIYAKDSVRVFRLELSANGPSTLSQGLAHGVAYVSNLEKRKVENGEIELLFRNDEKRIVYIVDGKEYTTTGKSLIRGHGRTSDSEGVLDVELIMEPDSPSPKVWKLSFIHRGRKTLTDEVSEMADLAAKAARKIKNDTK